MTDDTALYWRDEHKKRTKEIFDGLRTVNRPKGDPGIFVKVEKINYSDTENETAESVVLSVFSEKIYEYDIETVLAERDDLSVRNYRPFFATIIVPTENREKLGFFLEMTGRWMPAVLMSENPDTPENPREGVFKATLVCSASPFKIYARTIRITAGRGPFYFNGKDINDLIRDDYDPAIMNSCIASWDDINAELDNAWNPSGYDYIDAYNVGHGNADYIVGGSKRILYDIGYQYRHFPTSTNPSKALFPKAAGSFAFMKPGLVIISHWDLDHFIGCAYASDDVFKVKWIATTLPDVTDKDFSINAFRLAAFLKATRKLMLVDRKRGVFLGYTDLSRKHILTVKMGCCHKPETSNITGKNREGLFIEIYNERKHVEVLLAGDVSYNSMWGSMFDSEELRFLHVPHHCSKMKTDRLINSKWDKGDNHAVISTNRIGAKYDEDGDHRRELNGKFKANVHYTSGALSRKADEIRAVRMCKDGSVQERV